MRMLGQLLLLLMPVTRGCSMLIMGTGIDLMQWDTRESARKRFGQPLEPGIVKDTIEVADERKIRQYVDLEGLPYDEFVTHTKIGFDTIGWGFGMAMTSGLMEFVAFPYSLCDMSANILLGHRVRFVYNPDGTVKRIFVNGESYLGPTLFYSK